MSISYLNKTGLEHIGDIVHTEKTTKGVYSMQGSSLELENTTENAHLYMDIVGNDNGSTGLQNIKINNKNLFNYNMSGTNLGITYNINGSELTLNGTSENGTVVTGDEYITIPAGTYTISASILSGSYSGTTDDNNTSIYVQCDDPLFYFVLTKHNNYTKKRTVTFDSTANLYMMMLSDDNGIVFNNLKICIQIEKGDTQTYYEEYKSQSYDISLGNITLSSTDKIHKKDNNWYLNISGTDTKITYDNYPELQGQLQKLDNAYTYNDLTYVNTNSVNNKINVDLYYDKSRFLNILDKAELEGKIKSLAVYWDE